MAELNEAHEPKYLTRTALPAVDYDTFFNAVNDAFVLNLQSIGPPGQKAPVLVAEVPKDNEGNFDTSFDVIVFKIMKSEMAATDPSNKRRFPKGPTPRETKPHPTKARYSLTTVGWWEMMTVRFIVYSLARDRADEITKWFHFMMMRYSAYLGFFRDRGVQYFHFAGRGEDEFSRQWGQELYIRTLDYNVRLELLQSFEVKDLESINIQLPEGPDFVIEELYPIPKP